VLTVMGVRDRLFRMLSAAENSPDTEAQRGASRSCLMVVCVSTVGWLAEGNDTGPVSRGRHGHLDNKSRYPDAGAGCQSDSQTVDRPRQEEQCSINVL
jgi:hypothetical protein